jgi:asparagine synthase (glutamine-hydrolysing)
MCGIAGFYDAKLQADPELVIRHMNGAQLHRGPDATGQWLNGPIAMGHQRLSVVDLSPAGAQPMVSDCGGFVLCFNGEIYNHHQLREQLNKQFSYTWRGHSDTEVLLRALVIWGVDKALEQVEGMFAFALWDVAAQRMTLARDRFGEKPLYYHAGKRLIFGSELRSLEAFPGLDTSIDKEALCEYFRFRYFPAPFTIYQQVKKLRPAHYVQWTPQAGMERDVCYWDATAVALAGQARPLACDYHEATELLKERLLAAVGARMEADVPLGAFLSGGIDSSTVVALMQAQSAKPIKTFSIGFEVEGYNEAEHAKVVAQHLGTEHTELYVSGPEAAQVAPRLGSIYDEPFADSSQIPTFLVSQLAAEHVTVALSGDGGDELLGGYSRYQMIPAFWNKLSRLPGRQGLNAALNGMPNSLLALFASMAGLLVNRRLRRPLTATRIREMQPWLSAKDIDGLYRLSMMAYKKPESLVKHSAATYAGWDVQRAEFDQFLHSMMLHDTRAYLPGDILTKVDRASMAVSLETRVPMLDRQVMQLAWQLPAKFKYSDGVGKRVLKDVLYQYVPRSLVDRPKMGFGVPLGQWLNGELKEWAGDLLSPTALEAQGLLNSELVQSSWNIHASGQGDASDMLWPILMLQAWLNERRAT